LFCFILFLLWLSVVACCWLPYVRFARCKSTQYFYVPQIFFLLFLVLLIIGELGVGELAAAMNVISTRPNRDTCSAKHLPTPTSPQNCR
jgi:hypothetical protein